jgi:putative intracellular protease/amidase
MRTPLFRDHPSFHHLRPGPLHGRRVLVVVTSMGSDARSVRALWRALRGRGVEVKVTMETHGEAHGEDGSLLFPDCLLVTARPEEWDALVFAGGRGAARVAEDQEARELAHRFAASGRLVAAIGEGRRVLDAARLDGLTVDDAPALARQLVGRFSALPS